MLRTCSVSFSPSSSILVFSIFFFFNDTATTEIYTLSLHDALPISPANTQKCQPGPVILVCCWGDRKSTRLNSSHVKISYAVFCLNKKKKTETCLRYTKKSQQIRPTCTNRVLY